MPREAIGNRSNQLRERGGPVAGTPEHDLHHAQPACVADGSEPDRRNHRVAGGERQREPRELRKQGGAEHHQDPELTEPQSVDEEAAADPE